MDNDSKPLSILIAFLVVLSLGACGESEVEKNARQMTGGDPGHGAVLVRKYGCNACHVIPGVPGAKGKVGPTLDGIASRVYLAGKLNNTPQNLIRWIRDPQGVSKGTAMPNMGVTEQEGRDLAAFLYTLR
jgi:cytochrome c2